MPLLTTFQSRPDPVNFTPVDTPMPFLPNHRTFRCFRVGGPARPVSLNRSAGPASQSHAHLLPREPPPVSSLRRHAPTRRHCSTRSAPAPPHAPSSSSPAPRPRLARSAPTPPASRPRRACAPALRLFLAAPPLITVANRLLYARSPSCSTPLEFPPRFEP